MELDLSIFEVIDRGGFFVYPIILCSIIGLAIFLQKMWTLRTNKIIPGQFITTILRMISDGRVKEAKIYAQTNNSAIAKIAENALEYSGRPKEEIREEIEESGRKEAIELYRYNEGLGAISNVSTLLGLLGTISGMIKIFRVIADKPIVNPPELAGGISEALYTTALGLVVAIPAFIAYKYISGRTDEFVSLMEEESRRVLEYISEFKERNDNQTEDKMG